MKSNLHLQTDYLDNKHNCLTDAFQRLLWCIKVFLLYLWQVLLFTKEELCYSRDKTINGKDILSMNNSAGGDYSYRKLPRHRNRLPKKDSQPLREKSFNKTRVTVRSMSNQNLNRADSNHASLTKEKPPLNTLGTSNSHITVVPVNSSHCQNRILTNQIDFKTDTLCRHLYEPLIFINRGAMCCGHCRPLIFPSIPPQQISNQVKELSQKTEESPRMGDASETQSTSYSITPNIQPQLINSPVDEPLSTDTTSNNGTSTNEQNHSILSFPEHDTPLSQKSEKLVDDDTQLKLNAQIIVEDSIENANEKYQKILQMNADQDRQNNTLATIKQIIKNKSKSASEKLPDANLLCRELCNKLNLSDSNQITEILRLLASNAPHILKEQPPINPSNINKDDNTLCSQLLLHPPFKPKRLINLCPDGSIQVLSAVEDNSNENQINNSQQYRLNYSNSAAIDVETNFNPMFITEQSHSILSLQQKMTVSKDPIVKINLDDDDDENSLPEIFFKRIIVPECSISPIMNNMRHRSSIPRENF